jgi:hypothetical protein
MTDLMRRNVIKVTHIDFGLWAALGAQSAVPGKNRRKTRVFMHSETV